MSQWKNDDSAANSVLWAVAGYNSPANTTTQAAFFGNTTVDSFTTGMKIGQFGVDTAEMAAAGNLEGAAGDASGIITYAGSGYTADAAVTLTATNGGSGATSNAHANTTGKIDLLYANQVGTGYKTAPTVAIAAPANTTFNANTGVTGGTGAGANNVITLSSASKFVANDAISYYVATGNTAVSPLVSGTKYYVQFANATVVALSTTVGGSRIALTPSATSETGHGLQGDTATGIFNVTGSGRSVAHAGWVVRKEGTGGRVGRVQYETLVAMGSMTGDAEDKEFPDT
jgi:hypothetical protein